MVPPPEHPAPCHPVASVIVPAYNCADLIGETLDSLTRQTGADIEILVVDDASQDDTAARVEAAAARDGRIRLVRAPANGGPAAARNLGLDMARGDWIAFVDSDDLVAPDRLERLIGAAERDGVDIACDNVELFDGDRTGENRRVLTGRWAEAPQDIDLPTFVLRNHMDLGVHALGYLQPIVRRAFQQAHGVRFDERLRVGEDYDFVLKLLAEGARMKLYPWPTYFYRQRANSLSRLASQSAARKTMRGFLDADATFRAHPAANVAENRRALDARRRSIEEMQALLDLRDQLSAGQTRRALGLLFTRPGVLRLAMARLMRRILY